MTDQYKQALDLIKEKTVYGLCYFDGCMCSNIIIKGVHIDISCRKTSAGIDHLIDGFYGKVVRVYGQLEDFKEFKPIAEEIVSQINDCDETDTIIRYCSYDIDRDQKCAYCYKKRESKLGYFCDEHKDIERGYHPDYVCWDTRNEPERAATEIPQLFFPSHDLYADWCKAMNFVPISKEAINNGYASHDGIDFYIQLTREG